MFVCLSKEISEYNSDGGEHVPRIAVRMLIVLHADQVLQREASGVRALAYQLHTNIVYGSS